MAHIIENVQSVLGYEGCTNYQFAGNGIGKIGTSGFMLGFVGGRNWPACTTLTLSDHLEVFLISSLLSLLHNRTSCGLPHYFNNYIAER